MKYCRTASPCQRLDHLGQEFVINAYQKPPSCLHLAHLSLQQIKVSSEVKVSHEERTKAWEYTEPSSYEGDLTFFLMKWLLADSHNSFSHTGLPANPDSYSPRWFYSKAPLHSHCSPTWRATSPLAVQLVLPEEPVPHPPQHCSPVSCPTTYTDTRSQLDSSPATDCRPPIPPICSYTEWYCTGILESHSVMVIIQKNLWSCPLQNLWKCN